MKTCSQKAIHPKRMRHSQFQPQRYTVRQGAVSYTCRHTFLVAYQLNFVYCAKTHGVLHSNYLRKCSHSFAIKSALCRCSWKEGVTSGPTVTHWEMLGETTLRVISPVYLGGPVLNHGSLANATRSHSRRPRPRACLVDRQQSKRTDSCSVYCGCVTAISPVQQSKPFFSLTFWAKKCNNLNVSGATPSTFTAAILFMRFRIQYIVLLHMNLGVN